MLIVAALGGNALLRRGEKASVEAQRANVKVAATCLASILRAGHKLVITHGNGPQVGLLAMQGAAFDPEIAHPFDMLGAETEGMIGYMIEQELENALSHDRPVATLLTQVEVDQSDPAFQNPTKFIGPAYSKEEARSRAKTGGWQIAQDSGYWRRVVPSPMPQRIPDFEVIKLLLEKGVVVICAGGGGIPTVRKQNGETVGIEAVIDKDAASVLLAKNLKADAVLLLTDVDAVYADYDEPNQRALRTLHPEDITGLNLPDGSMRPKVHAAQDFSAFGGIAGIGRMQDALEIIEGRAGTRLVQSK
ncbi:MAG: carbamate kinase [Pseudomonadota bacterium]